MKRFFQTFLVVKLLVIFTALPAQDWMKNLPQAQVESDRLTFYEIQKSFNDYWAPYHVEKGYYYVDGQKIKAGGWKQFKRWEWFWNDRVDPRTGDFPKTSAYREYQSYEASHPALKSGTGGGAWTSMGPTTTTGGYAGLGRLNCVAFSPTDPQVIYVGAASGGLWKTVNGGSSWFPLSDDNAVLGISDLLVLRGSTGDIIYAATGDRDGSDNYSVGVLKSVDSGNSWSTTGLDWTQNNLRLVYRLAGDPSNPDIVYAATSDGLYKTTNAGGTWTRLVTTRFFNIKMKPGSGSILYASTGTTGDVYLSTNAGVSWTMVLSTAGIRAEIAVSESSPNLVYALVSGSNNGLLGVFKSTDSGASFAQIAGTVPNMLGWNCDGSDTGGQGWYDLCLAADPTNANVLYAGGINTWKSTDGGNSWTISNHWASTCGGTATTVHADKHYLAFQSATNTLFECNDGGLYKTANGGSSWVHLGSGLVISQIYRIGVSQTAAGDVICGLQDNGTKAMLNYAWKDVIGGDGMECMVDYTNTNVQYGELYYGDIYRTDNHWSNSTYITGSVSGSAAWVTPFVMDPRDNNTIYVGFQDVWKSTNKGTSWTKISSWASTTLRSLAVAPSDPATLYAATGNIIYRTTDGGTTWTNITANLPVTSSNITYISVKNDDPNTIWVSMGQFNAYGVFQSTDGGSSWVNISAGLPSVPVNCIIQNKMNTSVSELYAGTDIGVFMKTGTDAWVPFYNGLPNVVVMELEIYYSSDPAACKIRAATYGRGLWESSLNTSVAVNAPPVFNTDPITEPDATSGTAYSGSLSRYATDPNGDPLTFSKVAGPSWLVVSSNGNLSGTPSATDQGSNSFTVKVDDGKGGSDQATLQINVTVPIVILPPVADFSANQLVINAGDKVTFSDLSVNSPTQWNWNFGNGNSSAVENPSITYSAAGTYTVSLTVANSAGTDTRNKLNYITVVTPPPASYCEPAGINNSADYITSVTIGSFSSNTGKGLTGFTFYDNAQVVVNSGVSIPVVLNPNRSTVREYWRIWIDLNGDGDFTDYGEAVYSGNNKKGKVSAKIIVPAGTSITTRMRIAMQNGSGMNPCDGYYTGEVEDYPIDIRSGGLTGGDGDLFAVMAPEIQVNLYPNPAHGELNLSLDPVDGTVMIHVFNMLGAELDQVRADASNVRLDVSGYAPGVYFIAVEKEGQRIIRKFIKE